MYGMSCHVVRDTCAHFWTRHWTVLKPPGPGKRLRKSRHKTLKGFRLGNRTLVLTDHTIRFLLGKWFVKPNCLAERGPGHKCFVTETLPSGFTHSDTLSVFAPVRSGVTLGTRTERFVHFASGSGSKPGDRPCGKFELPPNTSAPSDR